MVLCLSTVLPVLSATLSWIPFIHLTQLSSFLVASASAVVWGICCPPFFGHVRTILINLFFVLSSTEFCNPAFSPNTWVKILSSPGSPWHSWYLPGTRSRREMFYISVCLIAILNRSFEWTHLWFRVVRLDVRSLGNSMIQVIRLLMTRFPL